MYVCYAVNVSIASLLGIKLVLFLNLDLVFKKAGTNMSIRPSLHFFRNAILGKNVYSRSNISKQS